MLKVHPRETDQIRQGTRITLEGLSKQYADQTAVHHMNLDVAGGEFVVLLGPSGCGKTTTLRLVSGLDTPSAGDIAFDGHTVANLPVQQRNVGLVSQRFNLFPHMRVYDNVAFGLSVRGVGASEIRERVHVMLQAVQLVPYADRFPSQLSGGQMQRVAIARTLVTEPKVLLLDEPFASLDTSLRMEMRSFLKELQRDMGMTTLLVTHDQTEAMDLADRIAVMFDGHLAQVGVPEDVYHYPISERVARFMGASNIAPATMVSPDCIDTPWGKLQVAKADVGAGSCKAMVRYEAIGISLDKEPLLNGPANRLSGTITSIEFLGPVKRCTVQVGAECLIADQPSTSSLQVGQPVAVLICPDHIGLLRK
ncbi:ABC transporter ATP-binding protein [Pseudovibrio exalbescens]|uniref:ABC transporter ATP-binding protein n=1 Tax=Pseudovibrio exalbescens TaxID=197461 RepID=UPI001AD93CE1|nr:ABC transporter ATP-binding protein [Pseudovibrio exalbescens]